MPMPTPGDIVFYRGGNDFGARVIRWWTRGPYAHCGIVSAVAADGSYETIEALSDKGVAVVRNGAYDMLAATGAAIAPTQLGEALGWLKTRLGAPYSFADIINQPLSRLFHWLPLLVESNGFDCSDLCANFLLIAGYEARAGQREALIRYETISPVELARILDVL